MSCAYVLAPGCRTVLQCTGCTRYNLATPTIGVSIWHRRRRHDTCFYVLCPAKLLPSYRGVLFPAGLSDPAASTALVICGGNR
jgi:hypothetical protein